MGCTFLLGLLVADVLVLLLADVLVRVLEVALLGSVLVVARTILSAELIATRRERRLGDEGPRSRGVTRESGGLCSDVMRCAWAW